MQFGQFVLRRSNIIYTYIQHLWTVFDDIIKIYKFFKIYSPLFLFCLLFLVLLFLLLLFADILWFYCTFRFLGASTVSLSLWLPSILSTNIPIKIYSHTLIRTYKKRCITRITIAIVAGGSLANALFNFLHWRFSIYCYATIVSANDVYALVVHSPLYSIGIAETIVA